MKRVKRVLHVMMAGLLVGCAAPTSPLPITLDDVAGLWDLRVRGSDTLPVVLSSSALGITTLRSDELRITTAGDFMRWRTTATVAGGGEMVYTVIGTGTASVRGDQVTMPIGVATYTGNTMALTIDGLRHEYERRVIVSAITAPVGLRASDFDVGAVAPH